VSYVVSFVSLAGAVGLLVQDALTEKGPSSWTGVAGVLQCVFVLIRFFLFLTFSCFFLELFFFGVVFMGFEWVASAINYCT
jgi:hypothetical protein